MNIPNRYHLNRSQNHSWEVFDLRLNRVTPGIEFGDFERASAFVNYLNKTYKLSESRRLALMKTFSEDEIELQNLMISNSEMDSGL